MTSVSLERALIIVLTLFLISIYYQNLQVINIPKISLSVYNQLTELQGRRKADKNIDNNVLNFTQAFLQFPWDTFEKAASDNNQMAMDKYTEKLIEDLKPFLILEPTVPINLSCQPPALNPEKVLINCTRRKTRLKVGVLLQFAYDVDNLEIHMNEISDLVDKFFIVDSTRTHFNFLRKPLIWDLVKKQNRFEKFLDKIIHVVVDDIDIVAYANNASAKRFNGKETDIGKMEKIQEAAGWEKFLKWNDATEYFNEDDLLGFGDAEQIPSRRTINYLKECETDGDPVDIGIWFPLGNVHQAFASDSPVQGFPFTLGDYTFWRLRTAKMKSSMGYGVPARNRGKSPTATALFGGMHMSHHGYLPLRVVQKISASDGGLIDLSRVKEIAEILKFRKIYESEVEMAKVPSHLGHRVGYMEGSKLEEVRRKLPTFPWFYDCNRKRYQRGGT